MPARPRSTPVISWDAYIASLPAFDDWAAALPPGTVGTDDDLAAALGITAPPDVAGAASDASDAADAGGCAVCGGALVQPTTGRPRTYCSTICRRQREYTVRHIRFLEGEAARLAAWAQQHEQMRGWRRDARQAAARAVRLRAEAHALRQAPGRAIEP